MKYKYIFIIFFITLTSFSIANAQVNHLVIGAIYGGGSNTGALYKNDFIELFNPTNAAITLSNWTVQYSSATSAKWSSLPVNAIIPAGSYYLIGLAGAGTNGVDLPTPDATGTINMSATQGKVALVNTGINLSGAVVSLTSDNSIIDLLGYGATASSYENAPAHAGTNAKCIVRINAGCTENNDNANDFIVTGTFLPQNSSSPVNLCSPTPVKLIGFNALTNKNNVQLSWETAQEINFKGFEVEKSNEHFVFEGIAFIEAKNVESTNNYNYIDTKANVGISYYRLKCIDNDGSYFYSAIQKIDNKDNNELLVYPNPVGNVIFINHSKAQLSSKISLFNTSGKLLMEFKPALGDYNSHFGVNKFKVGLYWISYENGNTFSKFLIYKK